MMPIHRRVELVTRRSFGVSGTDGVTTVVYIKGYSVWSFTTSYPGFRSRISHKFDRPSSASKPS